MSAGVRLTFGDGTFRLRLGSPDNSRLHPRLTAFARVNHRSRHADLRSSASTCRWVDL
jgi:hypothetical protein